jgi:predicted permease
MQGLIAFARTFVCDLRIALRRLRRTPIFTGTAVVVLGLGIGIGSAVFDVFNAGWFKGAPDVPGSVSFIASSWDDPGCDCLLEREAAEAVKRDPPSSLTWVIGVGEDRQTAVRIFGASMVVHLDGIFGPYFAVFGGRPVLGRLLGAADDRPDAVPAAVISAHLWRTKLSSDPGVLGSTAYVASEPVVVVGVVDFTGLGTLSATDVWVPSRFAHYFKIFGRLRDHVDLRQAQAEIRGRYSVPREGVTDRRLGLRTGMWPTSIPPFLLGIVSVGLAITGLILIVAGINLILLLLARVWSAQADMSVRLMLGASLSAVVRLWAAEVFLVASASALVGLFMGNWLARQAFGYFARTAELGTSNIDFSLDWHVAGYVVLLSVVTASAIVMALAGRLVHLTALTSTSSAGGAGGGTVRQDATRSTLVAVQVAVSSCMLLLSLVFIRYALNEVSGGAGFDADHVVAARMDQLGDRRRVAQNNLLAVDAAARVPGVTRAALVNRWIGRARTDDVMAPRFVQRVGITPGFFDVLGVRILEGRGISDREDHDALPVAVVSARAAAAFWPGRRAVGRSLWLVGGASSPLPELRVIGVSPDVPYGATFPGLVGEIYVPYAAVANDAKYPLPTLLVARGPEAAAAVVGRVRAGVAQSQPQVSFTSIKTMEDELRGDERQVAELFSKALAILGAFALLLAVTGLYGLTAFLATQRRREFGIRKALGATNLSLCGMLALEGCPSLLKGAGTGVFLAVFISFWLRARRFPTLNPMDGWAILAVSLVVVLAGLMGTVLPFARTLRTSPSVMLREQ